MQLRRVKSRSVAIDVYQWLKEINHNDLRLGGAGPAGPIHPKVVEIDESRNQG